MSLEINEEQQVGDVSVAQVAAGEAAPVITKIKGKCGMPVLISPLQGQSGGATAQQMGSAFQGFLFLQEEQGKEEFEDNKRARTWLTLLATVAASVTYQAGLNPPGGFWQADDSQGHHAGNPVLRDEHWLRYQTFYYFNATAFVTSLATIVVLVSDRFFRGERKVYTLWVTACINVASLIGAYAAGSTLSNYATMFVVILTCVAFVAIIYLGTVMVDICTCAMSKFPCLLTLVEFVGGGESKENEGPQAASYREEEHWNTGGRTGGLRGIDPSNETFNSHFANA